MVYIIWCISFDLYYMNLIIRSMNLFIWSYESCDMIVGQCTTCSRYSSPPIFYIMNFSTNLGETWYRVHNLRHVCSCSNKAHIQIFMNVKESWNDFMFVIIRKENWIVIEFNCDNFVAFTTRCWCHYPIAINNSSNTEIKLLDFVLE